MSGFTEDPYQRRVEVLMQAALDVPPGRVTMIAKKVDGMLVRKRGVEKWAPLEILLALEYLVDAYANMVYEAKVENEPEVTGDGGE